MYKNFFFFLKFLKLDQDRWDVEYGTNNITDKERENPGGQTSHSLAQ